jgi:hypothetical protein
VTSYEEDMIIEGSTLFNNTMDQGPLGNSRMSFQPKAKSVVSKDLTDESNSLKYQKGQFF